MATITAKYPAELVAGDILLGLVGDDNVMSPAPIVRLVSKSAAEITVVMSHRREPMHFNPQEPAALRVIAGAFTPAQLHAEELLDAATRYLPLLEESNAQELAAGAVGMQEDLDRANTLRAILAEISPPVPPTLEEALQALANLGPSLRPPADGDRRAGPALEVLKRARAAGLLK